MKRASILLIILVVAALVLITAGLGVSYLETKDISGTVRDPRGAPVPNATVTLAGRSTFANQDGYFELQAPRGAWQVLGFADGYQPAQQTLAADDFWVKGYETALTLTPNHWRAQILAGDTNKPLANARVQIENQTVKTDAEGYFTVQGIKFGAPATVTAPGYRRVQVRFLPDSSSQSALVPSETHITVLDAGSQTPLANIGVTAGNQKATTDANGVAIFRSLPAGTAISASARGYADGSASFNGQDIALQLQPSALFGRVIDAATQKPIPNAQILVPNESIQADASGAFKLDQSKDVPQLRVKVPGYSLAAFDIKAGGQQDFALTPFQVKGIHLYYGIKRKDAERVLDQFKDTEMNAVVFDVKEDPGFILWDSQVPLAKALGAYRERSYTANDEAQTCQQYKLYCIARLTVFKDSLLAPNRPDLALHNASGGPLYENSAYWTNPASKEVQDYHLELAQELIAMGFNEVQFDYIRYPGTRTISPNDFGDAAYRVATISNFLERAADALGPTPGFFSGDVFGLTTATNDEQGIGQVWENIVPHFDFVSPMMYPSTWRYATDLWGRGFGITGCSDSYVCPYDIIRYGVEHARTRTTNNQPLIRPWLQAYGVGFGLSQYLAQSQGADDSHSAGYLFWNNQGIYPDGLFKKK